MRRLIYLVLWVFLATTTALAQDDLIFTDTFAFGFDLAIIDRGGRIELPAGMSLLPEDTVVQGSFARASVDAAGQFVLQAPPERQAVYLLKTDDTPLLSGWLVGDDPLISPRSTAEVSLYFALGIYTLPSAYQELAIELIAERPELDTVATSISDALAADENAFAALNETVQSAIAAAVEQILEIQNKRGLLDTKTVTPLPDGPQSGMDFVKRIQGFSLKNRFLRPGHGYVERTQCTDKSGPVPVGTGGCPPLQNEFEVARVSSIRSVGDVALNLVSLAYDSGSVAYAPRDTGRQDLRVPDGFETSRYVTTVVGPGAGRGVLDSLTESQKLKQKDVAYRFMLNDLMIPFVAQVLLPTFAEQFNRLADSQVLADIVATVIDILNNNLDPDAMIVNDRLEVADYRGAVQGIVNSIINGGTFKNIIFDQLFAAFLPEEGVGDYFANWRRGVDLNDALGNIDAGLAAIDTLLIGGDLVRADQGVQWTIEVAKAEVEIFPPVQAMECGDEPEFTAEVIGGEDDPDSQFTYVWSVDPVAGKFKDCLTDRELSTLETSCDTVNFLPNFTRGVFDIEVDARLFVAGGAAGAESIGTGTAVADVSLPEVELRLDPTEASIDNGESQNVTVELRIPNTGTYCDATELAVTWDNTETIGTLNVPLGQEVAGSTVTYTANSGDSEGSDEIMADVAFVREDGLRDELGQAGPAIIYVEDEPRIIYGTFKIDQQAFDVGEGACVNATVQVPEEPGATRFTLDAEGGNDTAFWGERIVASAPPFDPGFGVDFTEEDRRIGLSGACGADPGGATAWMLERFMGFKWKIRVTR